MNQHQYFRLMSGANSFRSFFKQLPSAITVYLALVFSVFLIHHLLQEFTGISLQEYLAFSPPLVLKNYYIYQLITGSFVAFSFINLLSLVIFMIFFGFSYNLKYGNRQFVNFLILHTLVMSFFYMFVYVITYLVLPTHQFVFKQFNPLDLTHSLRIMLLVFWGLDFWDHYILPPIKTKHVLGLFLCLDIFYAYSHFSTGLISPWIELSAIGWAYLIYKYDMSERLDFVRLFVKSNVHPSQRVSPKDLHKEASRFLKVTHVTPQNMARPPTNPNPSASSPKKKPHLKIVKN